MASKKVLILGATGMIGAAVKKEAEERGLRVTAASRKSGVDANDLTSLSKALEGTFVFLIFIYLFIFRFFPPSFFSPF
jgi:uncharacterized protein YbjT (DUF2867 family)